jgi:hypothetical protein
MSNYSEEAHMCRVDFWKESGKWYTTEAISFDGLYDLDFIHDAFRIALKRHFGETPRLIGMTAICLEPYHKLSHPISLIVGE